MKKYNKWHDSKYDLYEITKVKCKCGHTIHFNRSYYPLKTCKHCGSLVFKNKKEEFKYYLKRKIKYESK